MARETFKDFLRGETLPAGFENPEGMVSYTVDGVAAFGDSSGLGLETNTGQPLIGFDAGDADAGLTGRFLNFISEREENLYVFGRGNNETYAGKRGEPLQDPSGFILGQPFVIQGSVEDSALSSYSNTGYFDDPSTGTAASPIDELDQLISKIDGAPRGDGQPGGPRTANDLLGKVLIPEEASDPKDFLVAASIEALKRNNRFNVDNSYASEALPFGSEIDEKDNLTIPGYSGPDVGNDGRRDERITTDVSFDQLKNIGSSLLLRATGYDVRDVPGQDLSFVESTLQNIAAGDLEESRDVQKKVMSRLVSMNATGFPALDTAFGESSVRAGTGVNLDYEEENSKNSSSFGSSYNSAIRFGDYSKAQRLKTAFRLIAVVSAAKALFETITEELNVAEFKSISESIPKIATLTDKAQAGKLILGQSKKSTRFVAKNYFLTNVLSVTDFNYLDCFNEGLLSMFGNKEDQNLTEPNLTKNSTSKGRRERRLDFSDAPGFWHAVSNSILNSVNSFSESLENVGAPNNGDTESEKIAISKILNENDKILRVINVIAIIGEKSLHSKNAVKQDDRKNVDLVRDPDSLPNLPGHRVGKSRIGKQPDSNPTMGSETTLAWEQSSVPSTYLLPLNIIRSVQLLNNTFSGQNPMHGMLGSRMVRNTYTGLDTNGTNARIPSRVVKIIEDRLDSEYVPFYFHDLRTNEIIAFHAFLKQLSDTITPSYGQTRSFGRMDPVQTYQGTTRALQVGFTVYATNREAFDEMWYKINKLVTLLYPQWTKGTFVGSLSDESQFYQPFTQVVGASPVIRLRVGDIIKSNYSRFNLARTFGIGDPEVSAKVISDSFISLQTSVAPGTFVGDLMDAIKEAVVLLFATILGSPQGLIELLSADAQGIDSVLGRVAALGASDAAASALATVLVNGYANPLLTSQIINVLKDPNVSGENAGAKFKKGFNYLNPNFIDGYFCEDDGKNYFTTKRLIVDVDKTIKNTDGKIFYRAKVKDKTAGDALFDKVLIVSHESILNSPLRTFSSSLAGIIFGAGSLDAAGALSLAARSAFGDGSAPEALNGTINFATSFVSLLLENKETTFMRPEVNPFTKAFETTRGRGLAGVMKNISFNWLEDNVPWETDFNARAPIGCDITFQFDVIHDIQPGIDHTGYNRAPLYNVGEIMRSVAGDPYEEAISESEINFRKAGKTGIYKSGNQHRVLGDKKGKK